MIKVTKDLKYTLQTNPHIKEVYFDKFGNHFLNAFPHKDTGTLYHTIRDFGQKEVSGGNEKKVRVYEVNPDHELVDTLSADEVLLTPIEDAPVFQDKTSSEIFEKQSQEFAKLKAENDDLKKSIADLAEVEQLKADLAKANEEKELLSQLLEEKDKSDSSETANENADPAKADGKDKKAK